MISGRWLATENGYNLEFQVPLALLAGRFSLVVADVDSESDRDIQFLVGKSATQGADQLGYLVTGLTPLQQLVADMPWQALVADRQGNILADTTTSTAAVVPVTAQIQTAAGIIGEVSLFAAAALPGVHKAACHRGVTVAGCLPVAGSDHAGAGGTAA